MIGINFNQKHSFANYGLQIMERDIGTPSIKKILEEVPFMNGSIDFSFLNGNQTYGDRELKYKFVIKNRTFKQLQYIKIQIENWLLGTGKIQLIDDLIDSYYFLAECTNVDFKEENSFAIIEATFSAYPFRIAVNEEGNNLWDAFNFELDCLQDTKFSVNGSKEVEILNGSAREITPSIVCNNNFELTMNDAVYTIATGTTKDYRFIFEKGINNIKIKGTGNIEFKFRKEVI